jgi:hypothetical protein
MFNEKPIEQKNAEEPDKNIKLDYNQIRSIVKNPQRVKPIKK